MGDGSHVSPNNCDRPTDRETNEQSTIRKTTQEEATKETRVLYLLLSPPPSNSWKSNFGFSFFLFLARGDAVSGVPLRSDTPEPWQGGDGEGPPKTLVKAKKASVHFERCTRTPL